jgi:hypothetical protein
VALLLATASAAPAKETLTGPGFAVALPPWYARCAPEVEAPMQAQIVAQGAMLGTAEMEVARGKVWAYEDVTAGLDRVMVLWIPGTPPPATDRDFRKGLRQGLEASAAANGVEVLGVEDERLRAGVEGVTIRIRMATPVAMRVRLFVLPRDGFVLFVYQFRADGDAGGDDAAWRALLDGITTTAGAPRASSGPSAAARAGRIVGGLLFIALLVVGIRVALRRKPPLDGAFRRGHGVPGGPASAASPSASRPPPLPRR